MPVQDSLDAVDVLVADASYESRTEPSEPAADVLFRQFRIRARPDDCQGRRDVALEGGGQRHGVCERTEEPGLTSGRHDIATNVHDDKTLGMEC
jgi:hypothetical protein